MVKLFTVSPYLNVSLLYQQIHNKTTKTGWLAGAQCILLLLTSQAACLLKVYISSEKYFWFMNHFRSVLRDSICNTCLSPVFFLQVTQQGILDAFNNFSTPQELLHLGILPMIQWSCIVRPGNGVPFSTEEKEDQLSLQMPGVLLTLSGDKSIHSAIKVHVAPIPFKALFNKLSFSLYAP